MFLRSTFTKIPRITHTNLVRSCTHKINPEPNESTSDWKTIYKFPPIKVLSRLSKLKIYQSIFTAAGVPLLMVLESAEFVSPQSTELFAVLGITGTISLSLYSLCCTNVIGFVYANTDQKKIRFAYVDFWGRRKNQDLSLKELVSSNEKGVFNLYTVIKTTTAAGSLKLARFGDVLDVGLFSAIFEDV